MNIDLQKTLCGMVFAMLFLVFANEASAQMAAIAAVDEPEAAAEASGSAATRSGRQASSKTASKSGAAKKSTSSAKKPKTTSSSKSNPSPAPPPPPPAPFSEMVLGDRNTFLNFEVASAEKPYYTRAAKATGAKGLVQVEVLVSTDGSVITAKARTGNKELWPEAERAALASKFNRPTDNGRPARAMGFLVYRFGPADE